MTESECANRRGGDPYHDQETPWRDAELLERMYVGQGKSGAEIAEELGCTPNTVYRWLQRHGIERVLGKGSPQGGPLRPPSETDGEGVDWSLVAERFDLGVSDDGD